MSFLARLAERTLGLTRPVQPLRLPRFADDPGHAPVVERSEHLDAAPAARFEPRWPDEPERASMRDESPGHAPDAPSPHEPDRRRPERERDGDDVRDRDRLRLIAPPAPPSTTPVLLPAREPDGEPTRERERGDESIVEQPRPAVAGPALSRATVAAGVPALAREPATTGSLAPRDEPLLVVPPPGSAEPRAPIRSVDGAPDALRRDDRVPSASTATARPTIRVTIGRVDVRAVLPAAAAPARRPPEAARGAISLDEYLRQRDRGGAGTDR